MWFRSRSLFLPVIKSVTCSLGIVLIKVHAWVCETQSNLDDYCTYLLTYSSSCQVAHKGDTHFLHPIRSFAFISTFFHERPICFNSFSAVLRHVNFSLPLFRFPSADNDYCGGLVSFGHVLIRDVDKTLLPSLILPSSFGIASCGNIASISTE